MSGPGATEPVWRYARSPNGYIVCLLNGFNKGDVSPRVHHKSPIGSYIPFVKSSSFPTRSSVRCFAFQPDTTAARDGRPWLKTWRSGGCAAVVGVQQGATRCCMLKQEVKRLRRVPLVTKVIKSTVAHFHNFKHTHIEKHQFPAMNGLLHVLRFFEPKNH